MTIPQMLIEKIWRKPSVTFVIQMNKSVGTILKEKKDFAYLNAMFEIAKVNFDVTKFELI